MGLHYPWSQKDTSLLFQNKSTFFNKPIQSEWFMIARGWCVIVDLGPFHQNFMNYLCLFFKLENKIRYWNFQHDPKVTGNHPRYEILFKIHVWCKSSSNDLVNRVLVVMWPWIWIPFHEVTLKIILFRPWNIKRRWTSRSDRIWSLHHCHSDL